MTSCFESTKAPASWSRGETRSRWLALAMLALAFTVAMPVRAGAEALSVEVEGLDGKERANALAFLEIRRLQDREDRGELLVRLMHRKAPGNIRSALRPFGYYAVDVQSSLSRTEQGWLARYVVSRGPRVILRDVEISLSGDGDSDPVLLEVLRNAGLAAGQGLRHDLYDGLKNRLLGVASERGYFEARYTSRRLDVYPGQLAADVSLVMDTGPRYQFGDVEIFQDVVNDEFMRRYLDFRPGQAFDAARLLDLQYALYDSDYFSFVEVNSGTPDREARTVPVEVRAEPAKRQRYRFGIGYGTDTEARVSASWENRRINRRGHKLLLETRLSSVKQELGGRYMMPLGNPTRERLSFTGKYSQEDFADTRSRRIETGVTHTLLRQKWERDVYLRLLREETQDAVSTTTETLLLPGTEWIRRRVDDRIYPRHGSTLRAEVRGSHSALGSDVDFIQLRLRGRLIRGLSERSRILARAEAGATTVGATSRLPASLRFFAGGDQSVRGFGLNTLGPVDENGLVTGGQYLLTGSLEFEYMFTPAWGLAVFSDTGNAMEDLSESLAYSAGAGIRWRSPVGMFRLDIAWPLSETDGSPRLHLGLGPEL